MEGRGIATGKAFDAPACRTQSWVSASMGLDGLRERATQQRRENMNTIASSPAARAVCGHSARSDLCGGRRVTVIPTATPGCSSFQNLSVVCPRMFRAAHAANAALQTVWEGRIHHDRKPKTDLESRAGVATANLDAGLVGWGNHVRFASQIHAALLALKYFLMENLGLAK